MDAPSSQASNTVVAFAAINAEGRQHSSSLAPSFPSLFNRAGKFVSHDRAKLRALVAAIHDVQIGPTNSRSGHPDDGIFRILNGWLRTIFEPNMPDGLMNYTAHKTKN